ncbi:MAG TPA: hypothetical protein VN829_08080 [Dongiaceae bacterium]|nr:hypothetical protein [Dongiaceae bacterium]HXR37724.1 hypothetical protein [Terracidiphilus sp.]
MHVSAEPPLFRYTRADALRDGVLLDITATAKAHADLEVPTAITLRLWGALAGDAAFRADDQRVKDLCISFLFALVGLTPGRWARRDTLLFRAKVGERELEAKLTLGLDESGNVVATIMLASED